MEDFDPDDIRALLARPWRLLEMKGRIHWSEQSAAAKIRAADELRARARRLHSDWPTPQERAEDLEAHRRLAELFLRGSRGRT